MIIITGAIDGKADTMDDLIAISLAHVRRSRTEPGCLSHDVHRHAEDANRLVFVERWADMDAVLAHFALEESRAFVRDATALARSAPEIEIHDATPIPFSFGQRR